MNGNRYILDTNAIVALLKGNPEVISAIKNAEWMGISIISLIEFLAFPELVDEDIALFNQFMSRIEVISLDRNDEKLIDSIIALRKKYRIKLPDSIIVSTALISDASLLTADRQISNIKELAVINF
jgi:tRNA(fMet)-specific endonuclease VapC